MLDKIMGKSERMDIEIDTEDDGWRRAIILSEKGGANYDQKYPENPVSVHLDGVDLPESVDSATQMENRLETLIYEGVILESR